jgi:hypothetical protein
VPHRARPVRCSSARGATSAARSSRDPSAAPFPSRTPPDRAGAAASRRSCAAVAAVPGTAPP